MNEYYTHEEIAFIHDSGSLFHAALMGFGDAKDDGDIHSNQFLSFTPMDWQDCHLLQAADLVAYDSFKVINQRLHHNPLALRKSLEELVGQKTPIICAYVQPGAFSEAHAKWKDAQ
jgi:hypothetical protein